VNESIRKAVLSALTLSGISRLLRPVAGGVGAILVLHRVRPSRPDAFQPNQALEVTPEFLEATIGWLKRNAYDFVSIDEARLRLVERDSRRRFVTVTLDDGYRDNLAWAKPIFARHGVPYTIYVPTAFADGTGNLWWLAFESIVAGNDRIEVDGDIIDCGSVAAKARAFARLMAAKLAQPGPAAEAAFVQRLTERYRFDVGAACRAACMGWDELRQVAADPLATIGAHTVSHPALARLAEKHVRKELIDSRRILEQQLQREILHLAYPFGSEKTAGSREFAIAAETGYVTAVTTRLGVLAADDGARLTELPRINVDGRYQRKRYFDALLSGVAPAIWSASRRFARAPQARASGAA
jgi:peptidoglycan/xylan/chitin deacetylase (PgdA/CDA1 family)